jgi:CHAD domain-containing protein
MPTTRELVHDAIGRSVHQLQAYEGPVRESNDAEAVHKSRVATRRLRSDLRTFRAVLDSSWSEPLRGELAWFGQLLGNVRDADVLQDLFAAKAEDLPTSQHAVAIRLVARLRAEGGEDRESLIDAMRSDRYSRLLERLDRAVLEPAVDPRAAKQSARKLAPVLVRGPWRRLEHTVKQLPSEPADSDLHTVRRRAKSVRYAAEAVAPVVGKPAKRLAARAEAIQRILGTHQDLVVADMWLADVVHDIEDGEESFVAGKLDAAVNIERAMVRAQWPRAWCEAKRKHGRDWF